MKNTTRTSTALLKKYISEKYGMKVKANSDKYSGGSSLRISYDLGLATSVIDCDLSRLQYGNFNGMIDMYENKDIAERGIRINGVELDMYSYVFVDREISDDFKLLIAQAFFTAYPFANVEMPETVKDLHTNDQKYMDIFGVWSISNYMYRIYQKFNFLTNDETQITRVWFEKGQNINFGLKMYYELNGQVYDTDQTEIKEELKTVSREKTIILNDVQMIDYSEKAIAVIGNSFEIKDQLKEIGGRYNKFLTVDGQKVAGWIFSKTKTDEVSDLLIKYSEK